MPVTRIQVAGLALALVLASCGDGRRAADVRRGRVLLAEREPDAAARELRIALRAAPTDRAARALLLVALQRGDGSLPSWYEGQIVLDRLRDLRRAGLRSLDGVAAIEAMATEKRQRLYDRGLESRDLDDLWALTCEAARYSLDAGEADERERDHAAFAGALCGDAEARAHLVGRLQSERAIWVPILLARLGARAEAELLAEVDRPESLARPRALEALAIIATRRASAQLVEGAPAVRGVRDDDLAADLRDPIGATRARGLSRDVALHGIALHDDAPPPRTLWSGIVRDPAVLVLQGYDPEERQLVTRFHRFAAGRIVPLALDASPEIAHQLATEGPIVEVALDASGTGTVRQIGRGAVPVLTAQPSSVYRAGDRVRVPRLDQDGTVTGTDQFGLVEVRLDRPYRGSTAMTLAASALRILRPVLEERTGYRTYAAHVTQQRIELRATDGALVPIEPPSPVE